MTLNSEGYATIKGSAGGNSFDSLLARTWSQSTASITNYGSRRILRVIIYMLMVGMLILFFYGISFLISRNNTKITDFDLQTSRQNMRRAEFEAIHSYGVRQLHQPLTILEFREFAQRLRLYDKLLAVYSRDHPTHPQLYSQTLRNKMEAMKALNELRLHRQIIPDDLLIRAYQPIDPYPASSLLWDLEVELFPWAHYKFHSIFEMRQSFHGRGLIIPTGSHHLRFAIHLIKQVRWLGCSLPILIAYAGDKDLKPKEVEYLRRLNVQLLDVTRIFDTAKLELTGWQIKPFALLAAPFEEVIIADADTVFLQNPALLLEDEGYREHGVLLFHDRTLFAGDKGKVHWLHTHLPHPLSERARATRMYRQLSAHELESGVLVWHKGQRLAGLLAVCKMNAKEERDRITYKTFYGDKESFWIGLEMAAQSWTELQPTPGVIGILVSTMRQAN